MHSIYIYIRIREKQIPWVLRVRETFRRMYCWWYIEIREWYEYIMK